MDQFAGNLNTMLDEQPANGDAAAGGDAQAAVSTDGGEAAATGGPAVPDAAATESSSPTAARVRKIDSPASEPVDLAGVAGPALLKRLAPVVVGLLVLAVHPAPTTLTGSWSTTTIGLPSARCSGASRSATSTWSSATRPGVRS